MLFSILPSKALDPDGYTVEFYKAAWSIVGKDFIVAAQSFFLYGFMPKSINATILSLVPKQTDAQRMRLPSHRLLQLNLQSDIKGCS